ncbi:MAG TPA: DUF177 domain-containing protein [Microbacteriaceae bacterium]|nr:DUF177 domain-containing protein [Microbacteriaceae bacterium]
MSKDKVFLENVRDIIHRPGEMRERERDIVLPERMGEGVASVPAGETVHLDMRFESVHEGILASIKASTKFHAECVRCLTPFIARGEVEFTELFAYTLTEADEYGVHGDHVNLEPPLRDAVVLALPFQPVCKPDCAGLDPNTGEKLKAGETDKLSEEIDPRWAALASLKAEINNNI